MTRHNFTRRNTTQYLRLGKRRKKSVRWQKPKGRDNKMRLKFKGYPKTVSIGYVKNHKIRGKINGKEQVHIKNINDLNNVKPNQIIVLGRFGKKKKIEIAKKAKEKNLLIFNLNVNKLLKKNQEKIK